MRSRTVGCFSWAVLLLLLSGCGRFFEDNGTHLAFALEKVAAKLRASSASEIAVHYETLDDESDPYYVEITPSFPEGRTSSVLEVTSWFPARPLEERAITTVSSSCHSGCTSRKTTVARPM